MKTRHLLISSLLVATTPLFLSAKTSSNVYGTYSEYWKSYTAIVSDIENGVQVSNLSTWGCRSGTTTKFKLDGLKFDFTYTNVSVSARAGFYFGLTEDYYSPQTGIADDTITFCLNTDLYSAEQQPQCRFSAFPTHDTNTSHEGVVMQTYTDMSLENPNGFGYSDGTAVMNAKTDYTLHFEFDKVDSTWYKMSMKATSTVAGGIFWTIESQKPVNDTLTVYFKGSKIKMDEEGKTKLFIFGFNGNPNPIINVTNYPFDVTPPVINLDKDTINTTAGLYPDESFKAVDDKDGNVDITYTYPDGALDNDRKLNKGEWDVILKAKDKTGNESSKTLKYIVGDKIERDVAHSIFINADGVDLYLPKKSYFKDERVWFQFNDITKIDEVDYKVLDGDKKEITLTGSNPFYFTMPDKEVYITAKKQSDYITKTNLDVLDEEYIQYLGRHCEKNNGMFFTHSDSGFALDVYAKENTNGITINVTSSATFPSETTQYLQLFVDGERTGDRIAVNNGTSDVQLSLNLTEGAHHIELVKCNEAQYTSIILNKVTLNNLMIKKHNDKRNVIEFYGDSISCGYGNLSTGTGFSLTTEDSTQAYTHLTADALGYKCSSIAFSGIGLYRSWTKSSITALTLYKQLDGELYDMSKDNVKISVINLGTNDNQEYSTISAEEKPAFVAGMKKCLKTMINNILNVHPNSSIVVAYDMMTTLDSTIVTAYTEAIKEINTLYGSEKVFMKQFTPNTKGVDGHPDLDGHKNASKTLVEFINEKGLNK